MNNSRILTLKNAKLSGYYYYYYFYMNLKIWGDFQISISAPLIKYFYYNFNTLSLDKSPAKINP